MTTNVQIIGDALRDLNVISEAGSPSANQGSHALRKLNQLLEAWSEEDKDLGYFAQSSTTADIPIPAWAEKGVTAALAIDLAPTYGATVSAELQKKYADGYGLICRKLIAKKLVPADNDHLPLGEGRYGNQYDINTDD